MQHRSKTEYENRIAKLQRQIDNLQQQITRIGYLRLFLAPLAGLLYYVYYRYDNLTAILLSCSCVLLFLFAVFRHKKLMLQQESDKRILEINQRCLLRLQGRWCEFIDNGKEFIDENHPYAADLDIFGENSLFQFINTASTPFGRRAMRDALSSSQFNESEISARQAAVEELAAELDWRQQFQACGIQLAQYRKDPKELLTWAARQTNAPSTLFTLVIRGTPIISLFFLFGVWVWDWSYLIPLCGYLLQFLVFAVTARENFAEMKVFSNQYESLNVYAASLHCIEQKSFNTDQLKRLQEQIKREEKQNASDNLTRLAVLVEYTDARFVPQFHFFLNTFFLWDNQFVLALKKWQRQHACHLGDWLKTIGQFELLASIAMICYDHPDWSFPKVAAKGPGFTTKQLGHPLIGDQSRRCNDLQLAAFNGITLVTGSNMSGKSTLLRTVGINLVLAYTGAPVCASEMICRIMPIFTSMRIRDDLSKNISTFYNELMKIKRILESINHNEDTVLVLIDEIFRGTNSQDRYEGAIAVIDRLVNANALVMLSTHDLALCDLEQHYADKISNIHFSERFTKTGLEFDYLVRPGRSTTSNAAHLMRLIGLEVKDTENTHA